jgi:hypothetical protein
MLLVYVLREKGYDVPLGVERAAHNSFAGVDYSVSLCAIISVLSSEERERLVYDGHNPISRALANWWDNHEKRDRDRNQARADAETRAELVQHALGKLTPEEVTALGITIEMNPPR